MFNNHKSLDRLVSYFTGSNPFTNVYGLARSVLALGTMLTFLFSNIHVLFRPASGINSIPLCQGIAGKISLFCLLGNNLELAKWIVIIILVSCQP